MKSGSQDMSKACGAKFLLALNINEHLKWTNRDEIHKLVLVQTFNYVMLCYVPHNNQVYLNSITNYNHKLSSS